MNAPEFLYPLVALSHQDEEDEWYLYGIQSLFFYRKDGKDVRTL